MAVRGRARHQPAVLRLDRGAARLQPGLGDDHAGRWPADVAGHGGVRRPGVLQRGAAAGAAGRRLGGVRGGAAADRAVLGVTAGRSRLRPVPVRAEPQLAGRPQPDHDRAVPADGVPGGGLVGRRAADQVVRLGAGTGHGGGVLHLQRGLLRHDHGLGGRPGDRLRGRRARPVAQGGPAGLAVRHRLRGRHRGGGALPVLRAEAQPDHGPGPDQPGILAPPGPPGAAGRGQGLPAAAAGELLQPPRLVGAGQLRRPADHPRPAGAGRRRLAEPGQPAAAGRLRAGDRARRRARALLRRPAGLPPAVGRAVAAADRPQRRAVPVHHLHRPGARPRPRALAGDTGQAHPGQPAVAGRALGARGARDRGDPGRRALPPPSR